MVVEVGDPQVGDDCRVVEDDGCVGEFAGEGGVGGEEDRDEVDPQFVDQVGFQALPGHGAIVDADRLVAADSAGESDGGEDTVGDESEGGVGVGAGVLYRVGVVSGEQFVEAGFVGSGDEAVQ